MLFMLLGCKSNPANKELSSESDFSLKTNAAYKSNVAVSYNNGSQGRVKPTYTPVYIDKSEAPNIQLKGYAIYNFKIDSTGKAYSIEIIETSEDGLEHDKLLEIFAKWHFVPITELEETVRYKFIYIINPKT